MSNNKPSGDGAKAASSREERLKASLKKNLQRRKAQARARNADAKSDKAG